MYYPPQTSERRVIGELLFSMATHEYVAVARTEQHGELGYDYFVDTVMILGLRFDQETDLAVTLRTGPRSTLRNSISVLPNRIVPINYVHHPGNGARTVVTSASMTPNEWYDRQQPIYVMAPSHRVRSPYTMRDISPPTIPTSTTTSTVEPVLRRPVLRSTGSIDSTVETVLFEFEQANRLQPTNPVIEVAELATRPGPSSIANPEVIENACVQFRETTSAQTLSSGSEEPQAGPSNVVMSCRRSVRPRHPIPGTEGEPLAPRRLPKKLRRRNLQDIRQRRLSGYNSDYEAHELGVLEPAYRPHELATLDPDYHGWCHICTVKMIDYRWPCGHLTCTDCVRRCHAHYGFRGLECYRCRLWTEMPYHEHPMHGNFSRYVNVSRYEIMFPAEEIPRPDY